MEPENDGFSIGISSSRGSFSGSMLVLRGVTDLSVRRWKIVVGRRSSYNLFPKWEWRMWWEISPEKLIGIYSQGPAEKMKKVKFILCEESLSGTVLYNTSSYMACIWLKATGQVGTELRTEHFKGSLIRSRFPGKESPHLAAAQQNLVANTWDHTWTLR